MTRKAKHRVAFVGIGSLAAVSVGGFTLWYAHDPHPAVRPFKTALYEPGGTILLRFRQPSGDELLLCYLTPQESMNRSYGVNDGISALSRVFRFSITSSDFGTATVMDWQHATGEILDCGKPEMLWNPAWDLNHRRSLTFNKNRVTTAGRTILRVAFAPSGGRLAVLSAEGEYKDASGLSFLGSGPTVSGRRFHELFRSDTAERAGVPIRLAGAGNDIAMESCWSADERVVVYREGDFEKLWVINLATEATRR